MKQRAVFLDRDGVINPLVLNIQNNLYESPKVWEDFSIFPYAISALQCLKKNGYLTFLVSNQPDIAKGKAKIEDIQRIEQMFAEFCSQQGRLIDEFYYCHHHPNGIVPEYTLLCHCRKPGILFLEQARDKYNLNLSECYFIGDRSSDILCGINAGCKTIRILHSHLQEDFGTDVVPDIVVSNLLEAVEVIIKEQE